MCFIDDTGRFDTIKVSLENHSFKQFFPSGSKLKKWDGTQVYSFDSFILKELNHCIILCKNQSVLWKLGNVRGRCPDCLSNDTSQRNYIYFRPQLSPDGQYILYYDFRANALSSWNKIYIVDINTGKQEFLTKGKDPLFAPCGEYFLFKKERSAKYSVFDRRKNKQINRVFDAAYWITD